MESETRKPFVRYSFFRVDSEWWGSIPRLQPRHPRSGVEREWRGLTPHQRLVARKQLINAVAEFDGGVDIHSYSLVGTRADVDFMLWQISPSLEAFRDWPPAFEPPAWGDT